MTQVVKTIQKLDVITLSNYALFKLWRASHLKIQKLMYYIEWFHLAYFWESLIDKKFQAWMHWPVCRTLFDSLKNKSILYSDLEYRKKEDEEHVKSRFSRLSIDQQELIDEILDIYCRKTRKSKMVRLSY